MKNLNTTPISGMQELLPTSQAVFDRLKNKITATYQKHGFLHIETPVIDRTDILFAKAGKDTEKQIYKVIKTAESSDGSDQALRFDHTVPLARYIIEHENDLSFPFKVSQIARNFRGERAQKGRFREFYQCDIDVIGRNNLPIHYDADVINTLLETFAAFKLNTPILARISNRKILSGLLNALKLDEFSNEIYHIIDHSEKVTPEKTKLDLEELNLDKPTVKKILNFIQINGNRSKVISDLRNFNIQNELFEEGINELDQTLYSLETMQKQDAIIADMKIVRGLDYYTGTVFEFILSEYKNIGSVCGGGRYDNLTKYFSEKSSFPGVGGSIGLTRLFFILNEKGIIQNLANPLVDYAIIPLSETENEYAFTVANKLRARGSSVNVVLTDKKLNDKLTYASKIAKYGIVLGETETSTNVLTAKDFTTGQTEPLRLDTAVNPHDFWAD